MSEEHVELNRRLKRQEEVIDRTWETISKLSSPSEQAEVKRRLVRLEDSDVKREERLAQLSELITSLAQLVELHSALAPEVQQMKIDLSNAKLIQKGYIWVTGVVASSSVAIVLTFLSERLLQ